MLTEQPKKSKLLYINYLRAFAIFLVVAGHTLVWGKKDGLIAYTNNYLFTGGTLLFVFIAGFLFQYLSYKFEYKKYLVTKVKNVLLPYWITMIPVALVFAFTLNRENHVLFNYPPVVRFLNVMCFGEIINIALWFVPMITVFFLLAPVLLKLKNYKILWIAVIICSFVSTVMLKRPLLELGLSQHEGVSLFQWNVQYVVYIIERFSYFFSAYILGMVTSDLFEKHMQWIKANIYKLTAIAFLCWIYFYYMLVFILKASAQRMNIGKYALIYLMLFIFIMLEEKIQKHKVLDKCLNILADYSFGIFFIHLYFHYYISMGCVYRSVYRDGYIPLLQSNTLKAVLLASFEFLFCIIASISVLFVVKYFLTKLGIKNTRMFTGVTTPKK